MCVSVCYIEISRYVYHSMFSLFISKLVYYTIIYIYICMCVCVCVCVHMCVCYPDMCIKQNLSVGFDIGVSYCNMIIHMCVCVCVYVCMCVCSQNRCMIQNLSVYFGMCMYERYYICVCVCLLLLLDLSKLYCRAHGEICQPTQYCLMSRRTW